jgi:thiamine-monophosphate kinase
MALGEFELIERFFRQPAAARQRQRGDVRLGIGDDAALLDPPAGKQLVAALDSLVEGRHFPVNSPPRSIGHRALAVNISDLAAMGADPAWYLLALTTPAANEIFLEEFAAGMFALADEYGMALVGGDTTAGPLAVSVQALGFVEAGQALLRSGAAPGDLLYVSGTPGDAAAGLKLAMGMPCANALSEAQRQWLLDRFHFPAPRVALGRALRGIASACIDLSDGLAVDAGRLAAASGCAVRIEIDRLPLSESLQAQCGAGAADLALSGGDDYELCFAIPPVRTQELAARLTNVKCPVTCIGRLEAGSGIMLLEDGMPSTRGFTGYDHFGPHSYST